MINYRRHSTATARFSADRAVVIDTGFWGVDWVGVDLHLRGCGWNVIGVGSTKVGQRAELGLCLEVRIWEEMGCRLNLGGGFWVGGW